MNKRMLHNKLSPPATLQKPRNDLVYLDVSGQHFAVERETLASATGSPLCALASDRWATGPDNRAFIAVDPHAFRHVLSFLRHRRKLPAGLTRADLSTIKRDNKHALHIPALEEELGHWYPLREGKANGDLLATMRYAERKALAGDLNAAARWGASYLLASEPVRAAADAALTESCDPTWPCACRIASGRGTLEDVGRLVADDRADVASQESAIALILANVAKPERDLFYQQMCARHPDHRATLFGCHAVSLIISSEFHGTAQIIALAEGIAPAAMTNLGAGALASAYHASRGKSPIDFVRTRWSAAKHDEFFAFFATAAIYLIYDVSPEESYQWLHDSRLPKDFDKPASQSVRDIEKSLYSLQPKAFAPFRERFGFNDPL